ncbi:MAG TPA: hypothetical protein VFJ55_04270 [Chthoniobacterales bacterium]|nr:hypothetical protein [Chthoniobacterales bacterium]
MDISTIANLATALTVIIGVFFGVIETRRIRRDREERAALEIVHALMTPAYMDSYLVVQTIRDGATAAEIHSDSKVLQAARSVGIVLEGLGFAVFQRIVPLRFIDDFAGGSVVVSWQKLRPYVEYERQRTGSQKAFEWFQWLAAQLEHYESGRTSLEKGAHEAYRNWKP